MGKARKGNPMRRPNDPKRRGPEHVVYDPTPGSLDVGRNVSVAVALAISYRWGGGVYEIAAGQGSPYPGRALLRVQVDDPKPADRTRDTRATMATLSQLLNLSPLEVWRVSVPGFFRLRLLAPDADTGDA